jgi:hypothetical protein
MPGQPWWGALPAPLSTASAGALLAAALFTLFLARFLASYLRRIAPPSAAMAEPPPPEPVPCGELTLEALRAFDGSDPSKPLYLVRAEGGGGPVGTGTNVRVPLQRGSTCWGGSRRRGALCGACAAAAPRRGTRARARRAG